MKKKVASLFSKCHAGQSSFAMCSYLWHEHINNLYTTTLFFFVHFHCIFHSIPFHIHTCVASVFWLRRVSYNLEALFLIICVFLIDFWGFVSLNLNKKKSLFFIFFVRLLCMLSSSAHVPSKILWLYARNENISLVVNSFGYKWGKVFILSSYDDY